MRRSLRGIIARTIDMGQLGEHSFAVCYDYVPSTPDTREYPGDPAEMIVVGVSYADGADEGFSIAYRISLSDAHTPETLPENVESYVRVGDHTWAELLEFAAKTPREGQTWHVVGDNLFVIDTLDIMAPNPSYADELRAAARKHLESYPNEEAEHYAELERGYAADRS